MFFVGLVIDTIVRPVSLLLYDPTILLWLYLPEAGHRDVADSSLMFEIALRLLEPLELLILLLLVFFLGHTVVRAKIILIQVV